MRITIERLKTEATLIDTVSGISFYEDPDFGDETGMWAVCGDEIAHTDWNDVPDEDDIGCVAEFMDTYMS